MNNKAMENMKHQNDISFDVNNLKNLSDDLSFLESKEKLEEIHSIAWSIQLKVEAMLRIIEIKEKIRNANEI